MRKSFKQLTLQTSLDAHQNNYMMDIIEEDEKEGD
jgi:hypothetical protein